MANGIPIRFSDKQLSESLIIFGIEKGNGEVAFCGEVTIDDHLRCGKSVMRSRDNRSVVVLMNESFSLSYDLKSLGGKYHSPGIVKYPLNKRLARGLVRNEEEIENR